MAEISREYLEGRKRDIQDNILQLQGAIAMIDDLMEQFFPLTLGELGQMVGAAEIGEPEPIE